MYEYTLTLLLRDCLFTTTNFWQPLRLVGCLFHETACTRGRGNSFLVLPCLALPCSCIAFGLPCLLPFITLCFALPCLALPCPGLAWLDLAWLGLAWLSAWLGLAFGLAGLGWAWPSFSRSQSCWCPPSKQLACFCTSLRKHWASSIHNYCCCSSQEEVKPTSTALGRAPSSSISNPSGLFCLCSAFRTQYVCHPCIFSGSS